MKDYFLSHMEKFNKWKDDGFPGTKLETEEFINHLLETDKNISMWNHQIEGILRTIYSFEILGIKKPLLNIVTGGGKTAIIAAVIFWLKIAHDINKFLILTPNTIVRARLEQDFKDSMVFKKFELHTELNKSIVNDLGLYVMKSSDTPQGMLESGIILGNIQQLYSLNNENRNLKYITQFLGDLAIFNDEAHNTPAPEYTNILNILDKKCQFRLDTTATPDRADGSEPDSKMIYHYDVNKALDDGIIKSIVVYQPEVKLITMTYTNPNTGEKKDITELDSEFREAEKMIKPFQWILDDEPMNKQISIALDRHREQKTLARGRYNPILFVVAMTINEGKRVQERLESFKVKTLLVTEKSNEQDRESAMKIGTFDSEYEAIVSVQMLREGWDVPWVSTILLLRKFSSPVYGQQIIGRGLRKILREPDTREMLSVVDHPRLEHDWLWALVAVSKIKSGVISGESYDPESELPKLVSQRLVNADKLIKIPDPTYTTSIPWKQIMNDIPDDNVEKDWEEILNEIDYSEERVTIKQTRIDSIKSKELKTKQTEEHVGIDDSDLGSSSQLKRNILEDKFKNIVLQIATELLNESGYGDMNRLKLVNMIHRHIQDKIFGGEILSDAHRDDIEFVLRVIPMIKNSFTVPIIAGIMEGEKCQID